jgi:hypothetical protein
MGTKMGLLKLMPFKGQPDLPARSSDTSLFRGGRTFTLIRIAVLSSCVLLMLPGAWGHSVTVVEFAHLPAGLAAWQRCSLGIYRVCGPLSKVLYALPAHIAGVRADYPEPFDSDVKYRREWDLGRIFQLQHKRQYHDIYRWSRLVPMLVTILGGCLICEWSTRLFGIRPGIVSLCVWCWMPPVLAHGSLVTSDVLSAVLLVLAARSFWAFLLNPSPVTAILAGLTLGLASATKFTLIILYPCWIVLLICRALSYGTLTDDPRERGTSPARLVAAGLLVLIISVTVLDALYLFHHVGFRLAQLQPGLSSFAKHVHRLRASSATAWLLQIPLPIPLEFLRGLDVQLAETESTQTAYLLGETGQGGWWYWYPVASLIKIPLPAVVLIQYALFRLLKMSRRADCIVWAALCLLVPAAEAAFMIWATTGTGTNASFRYLLPTLAMLCVWTGQAWNSQSRVLRSIVIGLLAWLALSAIVSHRDHLGWQNELGWAWSSWTGRPALIGDSLDWGQDQARLSSWVERHSIDGSTIVCVYGVGDAEPYGLKPPTARPMTGLAEHGYYLAVSENVLFGYESGICVQVAGARCSLDENEREILLRREPHTRVGRTIRIYRLRDLPLAVNSGASETSR